MHGSSQDSLRDSFFYARTYSTIATEDRHNASNFEDGEITEAESLNFLDLTFRKFSLAHLSALHPPTFIYSILFILQKKLFLELRHRDRVMQSPTETCLREGTAGKLATTTEIPIERLMLR